MEAGNRNVPDRRWRQVGRDASPIVAFSTVEHCSAVQRRQSPERPILHLISRLVYPEIQQSDRHECSSSKLCVAATVVACSSLEEVRRWLGWQRWCCLFLWFWQPRYMLMSCTSYVASCSTSRSCTASRTSSTCPTAATRQLDWRLATGRSEYAWRHSPATDRGLNTSTSTSHTMVCCFWVLWLCLYSQGRIKTRLSLMLRQWHRVD